MRRTRSCRPISAELWLNEIATDFLPAKHDALLALVAELVADGVPIHGVGIQGHRFSPNGPDQALFERQLRDFTDLGLAVAITELDLATDPADPSGAQRQADAYGRMFGACLAVPGCAEVTIGGSPTARRGSTASTSCRSQRDRCCSTSSFARSRPTCGSGRCWPRPRSRLPRRLHRAARHRRMPREPSR